MNKVVEVTDQSFEEEVLGSDLPTEVDFWWLKSTPEQAAFDESRGEIIKDISAIANASTLSCGFLFYGVDPRRPDPLVGISTQ